MKNLIFIIKSVLAAFCGIQSNKKFDHDDKFIQKNGVSSFILIGFVLVFILGLILNFSQLYSKLEIFTYLCMVTSLQAHWYKSPCAFFLYPRSFQ